MLRLRPVALGALMSSIAIPAVAQSGDDPARKPGDTFKDCDECPEMVVVPAGSFVMGPPEDEIGQVNSEVSPHRVSFAAPFAIGVYEVTFEEWDACRDGWGCRGPSPADEGWGRGRRPVINVTWHDAQAFVGWLRAKTAKPYRLPSTAEWEYAARAGTTTHYWWGDDIDPDDANYAFHVAKTTEVGSYPPNAWGLYDVHGNVNEFTEDCWNDGYAGAPTDGSAWLDGDCSRRVARGGSWQNEQILARSAFHDWEYTDIGREQLGFRVARALR